MSIRFGITALVLGFGMAVSLHAQTCASPIEVILPPFSNGPYTDTTCGHTNTLPYLANGAILASGEQMIFHLLRVPTAYAGTITLTPAANVELGLFVCRGPCSTYSTCIAAIDNGQGIASTVQIPAGAGDYFVIVGSTPVTAPSCGTYTLSTAFPLND